MLQKIQEDKRKMIVLWTVNNGISMRTRRTSLFHDLTHGSLQLLPEPYSGTFNLNAKTYYISCSNPD